jgi:hypothetical protein
LTEKIRGENGLNNLTHILLTDSNKCDTMKCRLGRDAKSGKCRVNAKKPTPSGQRQRVCRRVKTGDVRCTFIKRNRHGQIVDVQNIGKAVRTDTRKISMNRPKRPGMGWKGDY